MNYRQLDRELVDWFNDYQEYLQVEENRERIINRADGYSGSILELGRDRCPSDIQRGTLVSFAENGLGHYMAFAKDGDLYKEVTIFDPSGISGPYAHPNQAQFLAELKVNFPRPFAIKFWDAQAGVTSGNEPQNSKYDSWCQTWSLAWLSSHLQGRITAAVVSPPGDTRKDNQDRRQDALYHIVNYIMSLPSTPDYLADPWETKVHVYFDRFWKKDGAKIQLNRRLFY